MAHYNCVKWEIFENMQRGSVVGNECVFTFFILAANFNYYCIAMVGLYIMRCWQ